MRGGVVGSDLSHAPCASRRMVPEDRAGRLAGPEHHPRLEDTEIDAKCLPSVVGGTGGLIAASLSRGAGSEPCAVRITVYGA